MSISGSSFSAGYTGCKVVANTSVTTGIWRGFVVNADCVVSALLDKNGVSLNSTIAFSGVTLKQGAFICVPDGDWISSITLTSGSVILYNA
jgi:hypothetical protein